MKESKSINILTFLQFNSQNIEEVNYLIDLSVKFDISYSVLQSILSFNISSTETYPIFIKKSFLNELSWLLTELVCNEFYPEYAISGLEDFCLTFQDIWLDNESNNGFYNFFLKCDLRNKSKREIVNLFFQYQKTHFDTYSHMMD